MAWAKLHTDILGDPKLMRAARKGAKGLQLTPWLIVFAKQANDGGRLTVGEDAAEPADIAVLIPGATARAVADCQASLMAIGVLVTDPDGALRFAQWERRSGAKSYDPPEKVKERVRQFRDRNRNASPVTSHVTGDVTRSVTDVTPVEVEVEVEKEEEQKESRADDAATAFPDISEALTDPDDPHLFAHLTQRIGHDPDAQRAYLRECQRVLAGVTPPHLDAAQLRQACRDFLTNRAPPNIGLFRGYLRKAAQPATNGRPGDDRIAQAEAGALAAARAVRASQARRPA